MSHRNFVGLAVTVVFAGLVAGCAPGSPGSSKGGPSSLASVQVVGPDSLQRGRSAQFFATIREADGTTKSATSMPTLRWASSHPSVMSVSDSGIVTAASSGSGEAVITAEVVVPAGLGTEAIQGTRKVVIQHRADLTGTLEVTQIGTVGKVSYVFAVKLTESNGVPATVTDAWVNFDDGWGGQCMFDVARLGQTRVPANGTLALDALTCDTFNATAYNADMNFYLTDDNGYKFGLVLYWVRKG